MIKVLKFFYKIIQKTFLAAMLILGFSMLALLILGFLTSSTVGVHNAIVNCDENCYQDLGLANELPYREGLVVFVQRLAVRCEYFSLSGMEHDQVWQSGWKYNGDANKDEGVTVVTEMNWPINDQGMTWESLPIRNPQNKYEIGCQPNNLGFIQDDDEWLNKPLIVPH